MTLEELRIVISASTEPLKREMGQVRRQLGELQGETNRTTSGIQSAFKKLVVGIIALKIGQKIGEAISTGIKEAMNVEASIQQIKRIMGESSNQFLKWADTQAIAFNMSKGEAVKYGSVFGNLLMTFTKTSGETMKYTEELLKSSSIIASATGRTMTDVMERIRSGMLGNTEAIEDLGVNINVAMIQSTEAFRKFANGKSWNQLSFQTQQQIRLMAILEQTTKKYGDTVNQNTSSQLQQLVAQLNNVKLSLGQAFLPIVQIVLPVLTALVQRLNYVMGIVAQFSQALFGKVVGNKQVQNTQAQAKAIGNLGSATEKAGKQAKGALAGFDEINSLSNNSNSSDDGGASGASGGIDTGLDALEVPGIDTSGVDGVSEKVKAMADKVKKTISNLANFLNENKDIIISVVGGIVGAFALIQLGGLLAQLPLLAGAIAALFSPIVLIGAGIAILIGSFIYLYRTNEDFRNKTNKVWADISKTMMSFVNDTLKPIFDYIINGFLAPIGLAFIDYILPVLTELFVGVGQILDDNLSLIQSTLENIWGIVKPGLDLIKTIIIDVLEIIKNLWDKYGADLINNVRAFIQGLQETFQLIWDNIINPIVKPALEMITWLWKKHLKGLAEEIGAFIMKCVNGTLELWNGFIKPMIDFLVKYLGPAFSLTVSFIVDVFGTLIGGISDVVKGLFKILGGIIDFIVGVFTGNWGKAWQGVKDIFGGIFDSLAGVVKVPLNMIIDAVNSVIRGLNKIHFETPDWLPFGQGGKSFGISIDRIPKLAKGGIVDSGQIYQAGEAGKEAIIPLENNTEWLDKIASRLNGENGKQNDKQVTVVLQIGKSEIGRVIIDSINNLQRQEGRILLDI